MEEASQAEEVDREAGTIRVRATQPEAVKARINEAIAPIGFARLSIAAPGTTAAMDLNIGNATT